MARVMGELDTDECYRVVVVGEKGVGKSALAVRFLTKRFIGEYQESKGNIENTSIVFNYRYFQLHCTTRLWTFRAGGWVLRSLTQPAR